MIAIIGILISMLLPAVQQVRESARRAACSNNVKQLAFGFLNYQSSYMQFPTGRPGCDGARSCHNSVSPSVSNGSRLSGFVQILPFIEQEALLPVLVCGSNNSEKVVTHNKNGFKGTFSISSYAMCAGHQGPTWQIDAEKVKTIH